MKSNLRNKAKEIRKNLDIQMLSLKIEQHLISSEVYKKSKNILCYYSIGSEVITHSFFEDKSKNWFLPKINQDELDICPYSESLDCTNSFRVLEPNTEPISDFSLIDLVIIPCICADKNGYRIGYGKGYYDRLLKRVNNNTKKVVLTYSDLFFDNVFPDKFDEKADFVITDEKLYII